MSQSSHNNHNWLWIILSLLALAVLVLLLSTVLEEHFSKQEAADEFQRQQEIVNDFNEKNPPLNRVERIELKNSFFEN
jgi:uncharacterized protein YpmS